VASVPLLWVVPLALYLCTFILAFSRLPSWWQRGMALALPLIALYLTALLVSDEALMTRTLAAHLLGLFVVGMVCHGQLASSRPAAARLTEFYLWVAVGGALGSAFNALLAPHLFSWVVEYPLTLVAAVLL